MKAIIIIFFLVLANQCVYAQWSSNPTINNAVCNFAGSQTNVQVVNDGAGGAICTWVDTRNGAQDIYAQRIDVNGSLQWNTDGIAICNAVSDQYSPKLASDGAGGAIIAWYDNRAGNYDVYAQRINASGVVQWAADGVAITTQPGNQNANQIIADGSGGAIIVWSDGAGGGPNADIRAQLINASGTVLWSDGGASVCNASSLQNTPQLISDGAGGAIISWEDWRSFSQPDIYAQRISSNGFTNWTFNGVLICSEPNFANQYSTKIVTDGAGGAIICWLDQRNFGSGQDIYAQKVNASGLVQWLNNGIVVCNANALQTAQQMIPDGSGGAILTWEDRRSGQADIYVQRFNTSGAAQWTANGIAVCNAGAVQNEVQIIPGASGGAIIIWTDERNSFQQDIYAQEIDITGLPLWTANGVMVANESHSQFSAQLIADNANGAIIAWQDLRTTLNYDIYSSKLSSAGTLPLQFLSFSAAGNRNDVLLTWSTANEINASHFEIEFSTNGNSFAKIADVKAMNTGGSQQYNYTDFTARTTAIFYRIKQVDLDGKFEFSKVAKVNMQKSSQQIVYPNPAGNLLQLKNIAADDAEIIQVINSNGKTVMQLPVNNQTQFDISHLKAGIYLLKLIKKDKTIQTIPFIKQ